MKLRFRASKGWRVGPTAWNGVGSGGPESCADHGQGGAVVGDRSRSLSFCCRGGEGTAPVRLGGPGRWRPFADVMQSGPAGRATSSWVNGSAPAVSRVGKSGQRSTTGNEGRQTRCGGWAGVVGGRGL